MDEPAVDFVDEHKERKHHDDNQNHLEHRSQQAEVVNIMNERGRKQAQQGNGCTRGSRPLFHKAHHHQGEVCAERRAAHMHQGRAEAAHEGVTDAKLRRRGDIEHILRDGKARGDGGAIY